MNVKNRDYVKNDKTFQKYLEFEERIKRLVAEKTNKQVTLAFDGKVTNDKVIKIEHDIAQIELDFETWLGQEWE